MGPHIDNELFEQAANEVKQGSKQYKQCKQQTVHAVQEASSKSSSWSHSSHVSSVVEISDTASYPPKFPSLDQTQPSLQVVKTGHAASTVSGADVSEAADS